MCEQDDFSIFSTFKKQLVWCEMSNLTPPPPPSPPSFTNLNEEFERARQKADANYIEKKYQRIEDECRRSAKCGHRYCYFFDPILPEHIERLKNRGLTIKQVKAHTNSCSCWWFAEPCTVKTFVIWHLDAEVIKLMS